MSFIFILAKLGCVFDRLFWLYTCVPLHHHRDLYARRGRGRVDLKKQKNMFSVLISFTSNGMLLFIQCMLESISIELVM